MLDRENGNQSAAARTLGISRNKLARLVKGDKDDDDDDKSGRGEF
jgi:DNA-binding protein Fis